MEIMRGLKIQKLIVKFMNIAFDSTLYTKESANIYRNVMQKNHVKKNAFATYNINLTTPLYFNVSCN